MMRGLRQASVLGALLGCLPSSLSYYEEAEATRLKKASDGKISPEEAQGLWYLLNDDNDEKLEFTEWVSGTDGMLPEDANGGSIRSFDRLAGKPENGDTYATIALGELSGQKQLEEGLYGSLEWRDLEPEIGVEAAFQLDDLASFAAAVIIKDLEESDGDARDNDGVITKAELEKLLPAEGETDSNKFGLCLLLDDEKIKGTLNMQLDKKDCDRTALITQFISLDLDKTETEEGDGVEMHELAKSLMD